MTTDEIMRLVDTYAKEYSLDYREPRYEEARAAVLAAVESMSRDADRYRWLRKTTNFVTNSSGERIDVRNMPEEWDAAIDAAIQSGAKNGV